MARCIIPVGHVVAEGRLSQIAEEGRSGKVPNRSPANLHDAAVVPPLLGAQTLGLPLEKTPGAAPPSRLFFRKTSSLSHIGERRSGTPRACVWKTSGQSA